jgi:L-amino acid N-acyltransferase YncA
VSGLVVRHATVDDAEAICGIYNHEVLHEISTFDLVPRSVEAQRAWIEARSGAFAALVAVDATGEVVGFGALSDYRDRAAYHTTVENSVYVRRDLARRGTGRLILGSLLDHATASGFHCVIARIEASSTASRGLHESCGFSLVGVERETGRKFGRWLSVAIMQCLLHERRSVRSPLPGS